MEKRNTNNSNRNNVNKETGNMENSTNKRTEIASAFMSVKPVVERILSKYGKNAENEFIGAVYEVFALRYPSFDLEKLPLRAYLNFIVKEAIKKVKGENTLIWIPTEKRTLLFSALAEEAKTRANVENGAEEDCEENSFAVAEGDCSADAFGGDESEAEIAALKGIYYTKSFDEPVYSGASADDEEGLDFGDTIADTIIDDTDHFDRSAARDAIRRCVTKLLIEKKVTSEDAKCFYAVHCPENGAWHNLTLADLAEDCGYSPQNFRYHVDKVKALLFDPHGPYRTLLGSSQYA